MPVLCSSRTRAGGKMRRSNVSTQTQRGATLEVHCSQLALQGRIKVPRLQSSKPSPQFDGARHFCFATTWQLSSRVRAKPLMPEWPTSGRYRPRLRGSHRVQIVQSRTQRRNRETMLARLLSPTCSLGHPMAATSRKCC